MKVKKNKVKLQRGDVRIGNFVYHAENEHYKVQDINGVFSLRLYGQMPAAMMMRAGLLNAQENEAFLHSYAAVMYNVLSCVPDEEFMKAINEAAIACVNRHKEFYGIKEDVTPEEDAKIVQEEKELEEAVDEARKEMGVKE
jgi:hypothetical protein